MKTKALAIVLILALVLAFSGCLGKGGKATGAAPGIIITGIRSDFDTVDSDTETMIALDFENRGGYVAEAVHAFLIRKGAFEELRDEGKYYDGTDATAPVNIEKPINEVYSGDEFYWTLKAPFVSQDRTEEVQARLAYNYTTDAYATIHFVPQQILREKGAEAFSMDKYTSNSPVAIDIEASHPVIIRDADVTAGKKAVRINLVFSNNWNGRVNNEKIPDVTFEQCTKADGCIRQIRIEAKGGNCQVEKELVDDPANPFEDFNIVKSGIKLIQGQQGRLTLSKNFEITEGNAATSCQLRVHAEYRYESDSSVLPIKIRAIE